MKADHLPVLVVEVDIIGQIFGRVACLIMVQSTSGQAKCGRSEVDRVSCKFQPDRSRSSFFSCVVVVVVVVVVIVVVVVVVYWETSTMGLSGCPRYFMIVQ